MMFRQVKAEESKHNDVQSRTQLEAILSDTPITDRSIDYILGVHSLDELCTRYDPTNNNNRFSHRHPFGADSINELAWLQLWIIIVNYDLHRDSSKTYIQPSRDDKQCKFLIDELARQAIVLLLKHNGAVLDLAYLIDEIPKSKYLASNQAMCSLRYLGLVALTVIDRSSVDNANYFSSLRNRYGFSDAHASTRISIK